MRRLLLVGMLLTAALVGSHGHCVVLAEKNGAAVDLVLAPGATLPEQTAAKELSTYLEKISGVPFPVVDKPSRTHAVSIFVGPSETAKLLGYGQDKLRPEEWIVAQKGPYIIITGGRPRGTLYAVYHFLEDVLGVHWWNPWEEFVPQHQGLGVNIPTLRGKPVLAYRDIYMLYGNDEGRFAARNRLNRDGDVRISATYGGCRDYGPPYHVHTFNLYFPPKEYGKTHPEWYSLLNGKRVVDHSQLCLTNPELRKEFLAKLLNYIETTAAKAKEAGAPPPDVFSVSQNDWLNPCQCDNCQAIAKAEESECGPLLDFVNYLADGVREKYPWVYIDTLAYQYTQKAPKTIKARDNVIVRLCDTEADPTKPITDEANKAFREHLRTWAKVAKNLRVWDYAVTYANPVGMPLPTVHTYDDDFKFYAENNVEGVFTEHEFGILGDMRDFKIWMMMKLLENPYADYDKLAKTFMDGFYGPAGKYVLQYVTELQKEAEAKKSRTNWFGSPTSLTYLNLGFVNRAHKIFDEAEKAVGADQVLLRRVRHARLPLDRATVIAYARLNADWQAMGQPQDQMPMSRDIAAARAMQTWMDEATLRLPENKRAAEKAAAEKEMRRYTSLPSSVPLPEKFRDLPRGTVMDYTADMSRNWADVVKVVKDPEAESGITNKLDLTADYVSQSERYTLPMPWGLYDVVNKKGVSGEPIKSRDIPGPGYNWYKMGEYTIGPSYYMYFFWSWIIQVDVDNVYDPAKPGQKFEVWARIKFEGPRFPHAQDGEKDAIYVERLVLVKKAQ